MRFPLTALAIASIALTCVAAADLRTALASGPTLYTSFDDAATGWLRDVGYAVRGGYGRYWEDFAAASEIMKAFDAAKSPPERRPFGTTWAWITRGVVKGEAGPCTLATAKMAMNAWRWFAEHGVVDRPIVVEAQCSWVTVTATFRAPDRPRPKSGPAADCDVLHVVQVETSSGIVADEVSGLFGLPAKSVVTPAREGDLRGPDFERRLFEEGAWVRAARSTGAVRFGGYDTASRALDASTATCLNEPALGDEALLCGGFLGAKTAEACAGASLLFLTRELDRRAADGVDPPSLRGRLGFTCASGDHTRIAS
ncbi:MAG: hypothetical protein JNJ59_27955, partial [Deltaproteobacteria bacterium]|nr:hypothetical protein [Deltaproteobacteria bacterium]